MANQQHPLQLTGVQREYTAEMCTLCGTLPDGTRKQSGAFQSIDQEDTVAHLHSSGHMERLQTRDVQRVLGGQPMIQAGTAHWRTQCLLCALNPDGTVRGSDRLRHHQMQDHEIGPHWNSQAHQARDDGRVALYLAGPQPGLFLPYAGAMQFIHLVPGVGNLAPVVPAVPAAPAAPALAVPPPAPASPDTGSDVDD